VKHSRIFTLKRSEAKNRVHYQVDELTEGNLILTSNIIRLVVKLFNVIQYGI